MIGGEIKILAPDGIWNSYPASAARDKSLSLAARGAIFWFGSHAPEFALRICALPSLWGVGETAARRVLKELRAAGYLITRRMHDPRGRIVWHSTFCIVPRRVKAREG